MTINYIVKRIEKSDLKSFYTKSGWNQNLFNQIESISESWFKLGACEIGFFLSIKGRNLECDCIYPDLCETDFNQTISDSITLKNPIVIPPIKNIKVENEFVYKMAKDQGYWVNGEIVIIYIHDKGEDVNMSLSRAQELRSNSINIKNALSEFYSEKFERDNEFKSKWLTPMVKMAEAMEREADELDGFVKLQKMAHRISFTMPNTIRHGQFRVSYLAKLMEKIDKLVEELSLKFEIIFNIGLYTSGFGVSSSIIFLDLEPENLDDKLDPNDLIKIENRVSQVINDALQILREEDKENAVEKFIEKTKLSTDSAIKIIESIQNMAPGPNIESEEVQVYIPSSQSVSSIRNTDRKELGIALKTLKKLKKESIVKEEIIFEGELGGLEEFSDETQHYFTIKDGSSKRKIYFENNVSLQKKVDSALHSSVKVKAEWKNAKWFFKSWI
ncbi:MAG: hypothetical protein GW938_09985 [Leptospira sp.]|nr:hypothetical protein [Leptospira sp.]NCS94650.1 hypothetical protein [Leptospira sp.]